MSNEFNKFLYQEGAFNIINMTLSKETSLSVVDTESGNSFTLDQEAKEVLKQHYLNKATELNRIKVKKER